MLRRAAVSRPSTAPTAVRCGGRAPHRDLISHPQSKQNVSRAGSAGQSRSAAGVQDMLPFSPFWHTPAQCQVGLRHVSKYKRGLPSTRGTGCALASFGIALCGASILASVLLSGRMSALNQCETSQSCKNQNGQMPLTNKQHIDMKTWIHRAARSYFGVSHEFSSL